MENMDPVLKAIEGMEKKFEGMTDKTSKEAEALAKQIQEQKSFTETKFTEAQKLVTEANTKMEAEVKQLSEELTKKGATIDEISTSVKELVAKGGRFRGMNDSEEKSAEDVLREAFKEEFKMIKEVGGRNSFKLQTKAAGSMTAAANLTGSVQATYDMVPAIRGYRKITIRDLVSVVPSPTGLYIFYQQNIPVGESSIDYQSADAAPKNQLDYDWTEVTVTTTYLAGFARIAKQMIQDLSFLQTTTADQLVEDYRRAESQKFFTAIAAAAGNGATHTSATVLVEKYIDWIAYLYSLDYSPSAIVTTAANWAEINKTKPLDYSLPGLVSVDLQGTIRIAGIPLLAQNNIAVGKTLIGDFSKAKIVQTEGLSVNFYEQDSDNVQRNLITAKIEARVGLAIGRPDAFLYA